MVNGSQKFLSIIKAAVPKSSPNSQTKHCDVHDPTSGWMFPRNTTGHHKKQEPLPNRRIENRILHPIEKKRVPENEIPKPAGDKST